MFANLIFYYLTSVDESKYYPKWLGITFKLRGINYEWIPYGMVHSPMELSSPTEFHGFLEDSTPSTHIPTKSSTCKLETT